MNRIAASTACFAIACSHVLAAPTTSRVSVSSGGAQSNSSTYAPSISADGRYVMYFSGATNLVVGDTNGHDDVFVHDQMTGVTERVSVSSAGVQANGFSSWWTFGNHMSSDGRYVAFDSVASNLHVLDPGAGSDVFLRDRTAGVTELITRHPSNGANGGHSACISATGRYVVFVSSASYAAGGFHVHDQVYRYDRQTGTYTWISVGIGGAEANDHGGYPCVSEDGNLVVFQSTADNLVSGDTNGAWDVFVRNVSAATTTRASTDALGAQANGNSVEPRIAGSHVTFQSDATNLVPVDTNGNRDVFAKILTTGAVIPVSSYGVAANGDSLNATISFNGCYVTFVSSASNLVLDFNSTWDIFVRNICQASLASRRVSVNTAGVAQNMGAQFDTGATSDTGVYSSFSSPASNLVTGDTNMAYDIFVYGPWP